MAPIAPCTMLLGGPGEFRPPQAPQRAWCAGTSWACSPPRTTTTCPSARTWRTSSSTWCGLGQRPSWARVHSGSDGIGREGSPVARAHGGAPVSAVPAVVRPCPSSPGRVSLPYPRAMPDRHGLCSLHRQRGRPAAHHHAGGLLHAQARRRLHLPPRKRARAWCRREVCVSPRPRHRHGLVLGAAGPRGRLGMDSCLQGLHKHEPPLPPKNPKHRRRSHWASSWTTARTAT